PDNPHVFAASAALGRRLFALFDSETPVAGISSGTIRHELRCLANPAREGGASLDEDAGDLAITAGWGHAGKGGVTMPGKGRVRVRDYSPEERNALARAEGLSEESVLAALGERTLDIFLNDDACWRNVPERVWEYTLGGYQVAKKWLSYREKELLGRDLRVEEVRYFGEMIRRIAALLLLTPLLDENYAAVKASSSK
ncbi:DNA methyltransferase, partial [Candidatus Poribacteria bacterium]|nr:DNA methyltransferase [Candidatus Poribacteria bacterium]